MAGPFYAGPAAPVRAAYNAARCARNPEDDLPYRNDSRDDPAPAGTSAVQGIKRRIVYVIFFEFFAIVLASTLLRWLSGSSVLHAGAAATAASVTAVVWNFIYNGLFERWEARQATKGRGFLRRAAHAVGFEGGLVVLLVPLFAWILGITLWEALLYNLGMIVFFLVYTFVFNLAFDKVFGLPLSAQAP